MTRIFVADLDNDSYQDIIYNCSLHYPNSDYELFHTYILFNKQDGTFHDPVNYYTGICSHLSYAADLDGDGWRDIITLNHDFYNPPPETCSIHILFNDRTGKFQQDPITEVEGPHQQMPQEFALSQNYPNPFNSSTEVRYELPTSGHVSLVIFNITGQTIRALVNEPKLAGYHSILWDGRDQSGNEVASGIYIYCLSARSNEAGSQSFETVKKMTLLR